MKTKEELALEFSNSLASIKDIDRPRECINPGLYFGFIKGYEAALNKDKICADGLSIDEIKALMKKQIKRSMKHLG